MGSARVSIFGTQKAPVLSKLHPTVSTPMSMAFAKGASAYKTYLESPHGRFRLEIVWHQLSAFMAKAGRPDAAPLQVLDVGCGTGELALRLAARGHAVTLLDPVEEMLHLAKQKAEALEPPPVNPPYFLQGSLEEAPDLLEQKTFDLLLCHTVVEYLPNLEGAVIPFRSLLTVGGFLSLVTLNRFQEPLRLGIRDRKFDEARRALTGEVPMDSLFGLPRSGMGIDEVQAHLEAIGIDVGAQEGIFVFADYLAPGTLEDPSCSAALLRLELEAGARAPFKEVARYLHLWGRRAR